MAKYGVVWLIGALFAQIALSQSTVATGAPAGREDGDTFKRVFQDPWQDHAATDVVADALALTRAFTADELQQFKAHTTGRKHLFMPNPGAPRHGVSKAMHVTATDAVYFDLAATSLSIEGASVPVSNNHGWTSVAVRLHRDEAEVCTADGCVYVPKAGDDVKIDPHGGWISNVQSYTDGRWSLEALDARPIAGPLGARISVVEWERLSQGLLHDALLLADALGICRVHQIPDCLELEEVAPRISQHVLTTVSRWPSWRSYDPGFDPETLASASELDAWDRGNWANGYLPAAFAIHSTLIRSRNAHADQWDQYGHAWRKLARAFVDPESFPTPRHWVQRSTNHAAIIYGNMIAATLLQDRCEITPYSQRLIEDFRQIATDSFRSGVYNESMTYGEIFVLESVLGARVLAACENKPLLSVLPDYYGGNLTAFAEVTGLSATPDGRRWFDYGDTGPYQWRADTAALLGAFAAAWDGIETTPAHYPSLRAIFERIPRAEPSNDEQCHILEDAGLAIAHIETDAGVAQFAAMSMPLHLTHNKDFDLGSYTVALDGQMYVGSLAGDRQLTRSGPGHSTAWIEPTDQPCLSGVGHCAGRSANGSILRLGDRCSLKARSNDFRQHHRVFDIAHRKGAAIFTIIDTVALEQDQKLVENLVLRQPVAGAVDGLERRDIETRVTRDVDATAADAVRTRTLAVEVRGKLLFGRQFVIGDPACTASTKPMLDPRGAQLVIRDECGVPVSALPLTEAIRRL